MSREPILEQWYSLGSQYCVDAYSRWHEARLQNCEFFRKRALDKLARGEFPKSPKRPRSEAEGVSSSSSVAMLGEKKKDASSSSGMGMSGDEKKAFDVIASTVPGSRRWMKERFADCLCGGVRFTSVLCCFLT